MKKIILSIAVCFLLFSCKETNKEATSATSKTTKAEYAIVIHGGAGVMRPEAFTDEKKELYLSTLNAALDIGENILKDGGKAIDAVEQTIRFMENAPIFNAGKGAVFAHNGKNSLDASIMVGSDRDAGAIGGVSNVKNPISAARAVMEKSKHVMLSGKGAEQFAEEQGLEIVDPKYFYTERSWSRLQKALAKEKVPNEKHGTVGCVALDKSGNIVAGTSTGGMTNKKYDRIGDSPIIGAGTYADDATCGVSCTGHGEYFIRNTVARDIAAMMEYKGSTLEEAGQYIIHDVLVKAGGDGGLIAIDKYGNVIMPFNTTGMYRGYSKPDERIVKIFSE